MWRLLSGRHEALQRELEATRKELNRTRGELRTSFAIRQALAERVIQLESELKGVHWTLEAFFAKTQFWPAIKRFMGQYEGNSNDGIASKRNTYR